MFLKLYIYGYVNRIQSSRRLERECQRNVELMWLTGRLAPDFKTIADFRKDNSKGIRNARKRFVGLCRELKLFTQAVVAIDGSKFKAVNNRERNYTQGKIERRERELEENIQRYLDALETADRTQPVELQAKTDRLQDKITKLRQKMKDMQEIKAQLQAQPDGQISLTDPDARAMTTHSMKGTAMVGYNVQTVVDARHHLIVAHEVTNTGSDRAQLSKMALAAREAIAAPDLQVLADRGYYNSIEIKACDDAAITTYVPKPMTSNAKAHGRYGKDDFIYIARDDEYQCPAGNRATYRYTSTEDELQMRTYWSSACPTCQNKAQCTTSSYRRIRRCEHEKVDLSYVRKDQAETSVLFELISERYERRSILITANQPFSGWDNVFPDPGMTVAAIDRLVHHSTIFELNNVESYRSKEALRRQRVQLENDKVNRKRQSSKDSDNHTKEPMT